MRPRSHDFLISIFDQSRSLNRSDKHTSNAHTRIPVPLHFIKEQRGRVDADTTLLLLLLLY